MKNLLLIMITIFSFAFIAPMTGCKAKQCAALEDGMEGYNPKKVKKKKGRQEGLFEKKKKTPWN
jgi:hypothetical protein